MNFRLAHVMKWVVLLFLLIAGWSCWAHICVNRSINPELNADAAFRGPELAFQDSHFTDYYLFSVNTNAEFVKQIQTMTSGSCHVVLGLVTSRECLIAGPLLKKNQVIGVSPCCGHDGIGKFYPYLYAGSPPLSQEASVIADYLRKTTDTGKIFVVYKPTDIYSEAIFSQFKKKFKNPIVEIRVDSDGKFDFNRLAYGAGQPMTVLFFIYPLPSVKILVELSNHHLITKEVRIMGGSSWNEMALFKPIKSILEKAKEVVSVEALDWDTVKNSIFVKKFKKQFEREPLDVEIMSYDMTQFVVKCYKGALKNNEYNSSQFQYCLTHTAYQGVSGIFLFNKHSSFVDRPLYLNHLLTRM